MGLDIKEYQRSYSTLHVLRQSALKVDNINVSISDFYEYEDEIKTNFPEFINKSDCDTLYISKTHKQYDKLIVGIENNPHSYGDFDKLKAECKVLNLSIRKYLNENGVEAWNEFYSDVMSCRKILQFR